MNSPMSAMEHFLFFFVCTCGTSDVLEERLDLPAPPAFWRPGLTMVVILEPTTKRRSRGPILQTGPDLYTPTLPSKDSGTYVWFTGAITEIHPMIYTLHTM